MGTINNFNDLLWSNKNVFSIFKVKYCGNVMDLLVNKKNERENREIHDCVDIVGEVQRKQKKKSSLIRRG